MTFFIRFIFWKYWIFIKKKFFFFFLLFFLLFFAYFFAQKIFNDNFQTKILNSNFIVQKFEFKTTNAAETTISKKIKNLFHEFKKKSSQIFVWDKLKNLNIDKIVINKKKYDLFVLKNFNFTKHNDFEGVNVNVRTKLVELAKNNITIQEIEKFIIKTEKYRSDILFNNFKSNESILNRLRKLNKTKIKIDGQIFYFQKLLKVDWKTEKKTPNLLPKNAREEFIKLYEIVDEKDQDKKITDYLNKLEERKKVDNWTKISIGLSVFFIFFISILFFAHRKKGLKNIYVSTKNDFSSWLFSWSKKTLENIKLLSSQFVFEVKYVVKKLQTFAAPACYYFSKIILISKKTLHNTNFFFQKTFKQFASNTRCCVNKISLVARNTKDRIKKFFKTFPSNFSYYVNEVFLFVRNTKDRIKKFFKTFPRNVFVRTNKVFSTTKRIIYDIFKQIQKFFLLGKLVVLNMFCHMKNYFSNFEKKNLKTVEPIQKNIIQKTVKKPIFFLKIKKTVHKIMKKIKLFFKRIYFSMHRKKTIIVKKIKSLFF